MMMAATKIVVTANHGIVGTLNPYSYQVAPKKIANPIKVTFAGAEFSGWLTSGRGKGDRVRCYAYFKDDRINWIELTEAAFEELKKNPAAVLELTPSAAPKAVEEPKSVEGVPAAELVKAAKFLEKGKKAKREVTA